MDQYELGVAMAAAHLAELRRQADRWRLARRIPGRIAGRRRNRTPGWPWVLGRHDRAVDCAGGRAVAVAAASAPGPAATEAAMLVQHHHQPGVFDADHCRACARQAAGLLDHYRRVQQEEATLREAHARALEACRRASGALWSAGAAILLAVVALLRG
jgi:hypothetical protein